MSDIAATVPPFFVPSLRFSGFTAPWEQRKLGELAKTTYGGGTPNTSVNEYWGGKTPWIQSSNVIEDELFVVDIPKAITRKGLIESAAVLVPKNSIAVVTHVGVGKLVYLPFSYATSQDFISLSELQGDAVYLCYAIYEKLQSELHMVQGSAIKGITKEELLGKAISIPSVDEQRAIGRQLRALDTLITLHQRERDQLAAAKAALLGLMFPKQGESEPSLRFSGFTAPWEQRKLGEVAEVNPAAELPDSFEYVDLESVVGTSMLSHRREDKTAAPSRAQRLAKMGDIFYQTVRPYQKNNYLFELPDRDYVFSTGYAQLRPNQSGRFLFALLQRDSFVKQVLDRCTGTGYPAINANDLADLDISIPSDRTEQEWIGSSLRFLDTLVTLHQRERDALRAAKAALLGLMFPGSDPAPRDPLCYLRKV